jgi:hypothetical protein
MDTSLLGGWRLEDIAVVSRFRARRYRLDLRVGVETLVFGEIQRLERVLESRMTCGCSSSPTKLFDSAVTTSRL